MAEPQRTRSESSSPGAPVELDDDHGLPGGAAQDQEEQLELRRGPWTVDEDLTLVNYIACHGEGRWNSLARATGLKRTGKSCRLRWLNYLRPDVRRGNITADEQLLILDLHTRWGNRWSKIAQHLPGRTDNEIKNYFRTRVRKHAKQLNCDANSKRFKDTMRYLLMPHLVDAAARRCRLQAQHHQHAAAAHGLSAIGMVTSSSDSFATTAESYRPGKLDSLLRHGCALPKGVADEISLIKLDLEKIIAISSNLQEDDHAMMVRCWRKEVRELSYDMDDFADQYEHAAAMTCARSIRGREITRQLKSKRSLPWIREKLRQRLWMANKIREFSERTQEALERHRLYNLDAIAGSASFSCTDDAYPTSWNGTPYGEDKAYVGIDAAMEKLEELLMMTHDQGHQKLQVVSIVGFGGVGKTTLAMELYRKLGHQFECRAFVRTSQKPDMRRIFISMLSQVRPHQPPDNWTVHGLISTIRTHLQDKRYLIIVENLWTTSTWDIVKHALPDSNCCSRILTTTEIEDLALQSCDHDPKYVYKMQPLGEDNSRKLFFSSVFGPQDECPPELREISHDIIRKCGGLPLAIVTVASILSSQPGKQDRWDYVNKAIGYSLLTNPTWEGMKQIFDLSYNNLPQHLKACILYTGLYEEDIVIWKDDLVNQWLAEGFIQAKEGQDKKEIASSFFDRLINGKLILPVDANKKGEVLSCTIHHMVLNLGIRCKSIEENFVTAIHHSQATTTLADKVRRLSLQFGNAEDAITPPNMRLSHVRTLAFWGVFQCLPSVVQFRLLQVLILHFWGDKDSISFDITTISELFRLRYLKVTSNVTLELRTQMRGLNSLETLTIDARVSSVPSDIVHLPGLLHLSLPAETNLPNGIGHMTSLRTLGCFDISGNSIENVQSLSMLTNLEDLQLTCSTVQTENLNSKMHFVLNSILGSLSNLKCLTLASRAPSYAKSIGATGMTISGGFSSLSSAPALLRTLEVSPQICIFFYTPKWIGQLRELCVLKFGVRRIDMDGVDVLGGLPALSVLTLYVQTKPAARIVIGKTGFQVIKYFRFKCCDALLEFKEGAMPNLRTLKLAFNANSNADQQSTIPVGIEYLSELKEVSAKIGGVGPEESHRRAAELEFRDAIRVHARFQRVNVRCVKQIIECKDDQSSVTTVEHSDDQSSVTTVEYSAASAGTSLLHTTRGLQCGQAHVSVGASPSGVPLAAYRDRQDNILREPLTLANSDSLAALLRRVPVEEVGPEEDRQDTVPEHYAPGRGLWVMDQAAALPGPAPAFEAPVVMADPRKRSAEYQLAPEREASGVKRQRPPTSSRENSGGSNDGDHEHSSAAAGGKGGGRRLWVKERDHKWWDRMSACLGDEFRRAFRMSRATFEAVCRELAKEDTILRATIPVHQRVAVCIWRLATGEPLHLVSERFDLSISTCYRLELEVCAAIKAVLMPKAVQWPEAPADVAAQFEAASGIANVVGAMYTTHIPIIVPQANIAAYYNRRHTERNRKSSYSITVQGVVDAAGAFTNVCIGCPGSMSDADVLERSALYAQRGAAGRLQGQWVVGGAGYPLMDWLLVPYTHQNNITWAQHVFNERVDGVRAVARDAFQRLKARWGCLQKRIKVNLQDLPVVLSACCVLHNICERAGDAVDPENAFQIFDDYMVAENPVRSQAAVTARDEITHNLF